MSKMVRQSKQRDAILNQLTDRGDHPTAEMLYLELKGNMPNLSLATVYRNLTQLESWGEIQRVGTEGSTRYDFNTAPHSHFICTECGAVIDIDCDVDAILEAGQGNFDGTVTRCVTSFYGLCPKCKKQN